MTARRAGFSLVELLIVVVLGAVVMSAVYQTLAVQERTSRQLNAVITTQQTMRTAVQVLAAELRQSSANGGDIAMASTDSIRFRVLEKVGFVCTTDATGPSIDVHRMGTLDFAKDDSILIFADHAPDTGGDDAWNVTGVANTPSHTTCSTSWPGTTDDRIGGISGSALSGVLEDAPVRSFRWVTYGLYQIAGQWSLGRRIAGDTAVALIGPLAPPAQNGLVLGYLDASGAATINPANIALVTITAKGLTPGTGSSSARVYADSLTTQVYLRGN